MEGKASSPGFDPSLLPSVDEVLSQGTVAELAGTFGRERVVAAVRSLIADRRRRLLDGTLENSADRKAVVADLVQELAELASADRRTGVRRVINATGVVVHTNLGRAPFCDAAIEAMREAGGYATVEYDLNKGARGKRAPKAVELVKLLTGGEDALAVNNCAAAALLILSVFAQGREVIVSRGELVEIGGDFRVPDILARSGAILKEVGTTNRTHLRDYENAVSDRTAMILKVHPSNFRITGFTKSPATAELAGLARERGLIFYEDAGSGALTDLGEAGVRGEPVIREVLEAGADLVSFSGDKLLGGPQAGIIAGRSELVERLRRDPFYRALRLDKTLSAALEATLESYAIGTAKENIPVLRMLAATAEQLAGRAAAFAERVSAAAGEGLTVELLEGVSAVGGGAAPDAALPATLVSLTHSSKSDTEIERSLRFSDPPVIARIEDGRVLLDLRTVPEGDETALAAAVANIG